MSFILPGGFRQWLSLPPPSQAPACCGQVQVAGPYLGSHGTLQAEQTPLRVQGLPASSLSTGGSLSRMHNCLSTFDLLQFESPLPVWMGTVGSSSVSLPGICVDFCVMILHILKKFFSYRWLLLVILLLSVTLFPPFNFVEAEMFF